MDGQPRHLVLPSAVGACVASRSHITCLPSCLRAYKEQRFPASVRLLYLSVTCMARVVGSPSRRYLSIAPDPACRHGESSCRRSMSALSNPSNLGRSSWRAHPLPRAAKLASDSESTPPPADAFHFTCTSLSARRSPARRTTPPLHALYLYYS